MSRAIQPVYLSCEAGSLANQEEQRSAKRVLPPQHPARPRRSPRPLLQTAAAEEGQTTRGRRPTGTAPCAGSWPTWGRRCWWQVRLMPSILPPARPPLPNQTPCLPACLTHPHWQLQEACRCLVALTGPAGCLASLLAMQMWSCGRTAPSSSSLTTPASASWTAACRPTWRTAT